MPQLSNHVAAECRSCGSPIAPDEPILVSFQRCYYCGCRHPLGRRWTLATMPLLVAAFAGLVALWWSSLSS